MKCCRALRLADNPQGGLFVDDSKQLSSSWLRGRGSSESRRHGIKSLPKQGFWDGGQRKTTEIFVQCVDKNIPVASFCSDTTDQVATSQAFPQTQNNSFISGSTTTVVGIEE